MLAAACLRATFLIIALLLFVPFCFLAAPASMAAALESPLSASVVSGQGRSPMTAAGRAGRVKEPTLPLKLGRARENVYKAPETVSYFLEHGLPCFFGPLYAQTLQGRRSPPARRNGGARISQHAQLPDQAEPT